MIIAILLLVIVASVVLVLFILAQNPKGGGLSTTFGGASQIIGARQTADFLEKASWYIGIGILAAVLITNFFTPSGVSQRERQSAMAEQIDELPAPVAQNPTPSQADKQVQQQGQQEPQPAQQTQKETPKPAPVK